MKISTSYLDNAVDMSKLPGTVDTLAHCIIASGVQFDAIAFRGMSGALVAPMLAVKLGKGLIICRKPSEQSHAEAVEGSVMSGERYIIVDDFITSGRTCREIYAAIRDFSIAARRWDATRADLVPVAVFLYRRFESSYRLTVNRTVTLKQGNAGELVNDCVEVPLFGCHPHGT